MLHAIDVSHHQNPQTLDWSGMRQAGCDVCIVRLTYGTKKDALAKEHVRLARAHGFAIGAYAFVRNVQNAASQAETFIEAAYDVDYGRPEDVVMAVDVEDDTEKRPILPMHAPIFEEFTERMRDWKKTDPYCYITQRDWGRLGKPAWVLALPLFVAHYASPSRKEPATPNGMPWSIWQHRVGPFDLLGPSGYYKSPREIDQSRARVLRFFNGEVFESNEPEDVELRKIADDGDSTPIIRQERMDDYVRAYATEVAESARFMNLEDLRRAGRRGEITGHDDDAPASEPPENIS